MASAYEDFFGSPPPSGNQGGAQTKSAAVSSLTSAPKTTPAMQEFFGSDTQPAPQPITVNRDTKAKQDFFTPKPVPPRSPGIQQLLSGPAPDTSTSGHFLSGLLSVPSQLGVGGTFGRDVGNAAITPVRDFVKSTVSMFNKPSSVEQEIEKNTVNKIDSGNDPIAVTQRLGLRAISPITNAFISGGRQMAQSFSDQALGTDGKINPVLQKNLTTTAKQSTPEVEQDPKAFLGKINQSKQVITDLGSQLDKAQKGSKNYNSLATKYNNAVNAYEGQVKALEGYSAKSQLLGYQQSAAQHAPLPIVGLSPTDFESALNIGASSVGIYEALNPAAKSATLKLADIAEREGKVPITFKDVQNITTGNEHLVDPEKVDAYKQAAADNLSLKKIVQQGYVKLAQKQPTALSNILKNSATRPISEIGNLSDTFGQTPSVPNTKLLSDGRVEPFAHEAAPAEVQVKPFSHETPAAAPGASVKPFIDEAGKVDATHEPFSDTIKNQLPDRVIQTPAGFHTIPLDQSTSALSSVHNERIVEKSPSQMEALGEKNLGPFTMETQKPGEAPAEQKSLNLAPQKDAFSQKFGSNPTLEERQAALKEEQDIKNSGQTAIPTGREALGMTKKEVQSVKKDSFKYPDAQTENNYQKFKRQFSRFSANVPEDATQFKAMVPGSKDLFYSQEHGDEQMFDQFKERSELEKLAQQGSVNPGQAFSDIMGAVDKYKQHIADTKAGEALRTKYIGNVNARIVQDNQLFDSFEKIIKTPLEQEALTLYRNFKDKPGELKAMLDGTHPEYKIAADKFKEHNPGATAADIKAFKQLSLENVRKFSKVIQLALNPNAGIIAVDKALDNYFANKLKEGQDKKFLDSNLDPKIYMMQMTTPQTMTKGVVGKATRGVMGKKFENAMKRYFDTPLHALVNHFQPRTINGIGLGRIYAARHAPAAATYDFIQQLKEVQLAGIDEKHVPADWKEVRIGDTKIFLPGKLADSLEILFEKDLSQQANMLGKITKFEMLVKSGEVAASIFHYKALSLTASNSMSPLAAAKAMMSDVETERFKNDEIDLVKHGGTTAELGQTAEAYKLANKGTAITRGDIIKNVPGIKHAIALSDALTHATFNVAQRKYKVDDFALKRDAYLAKHPNATEEQIAQAKREFASYVNSVYGGLNWKVLGVRNLTRSIARALVFAPDWTYSNFLTGKAVFTGGESKGAAFMFFLKSAIATAVLSQAASLLITKKISKHPFRVYLGKDKNGKEMYGNWFSVGAFGDLINEITNAEKYGLITGTFQTLGNKLASLPRSVVHQMTNQNFLHQQIAIKGASPAVNTARSAIEMASENVPLPFALTDSIKMIIDKKTARNFWDYASIILGTAPTHELPDNTHVPTTGKQKGQVVPNKPNTRPQNSFLDQVNTGNIFKPGTKNKANPSRSR